MSYTFLLAGLCLLTVPFTVADIRDKLCGIFGGKEKQVMFDCMKGWDRFIIESISANLATTLSDEIIDVCRDNSLNTTRQCVSEMSGNGKNAFKCADVLLLWRHIYDPMDYICQQMTDYKVATRCRANIRVPMMRCVDVIRKLKQCNKNNRDFNCRKLLEYRECLWQLKPECASKSTVLLESVIGIHLKHLRAFHQCDTDQHPSNFEFQK